VDPLFAELPMRGFPVDIALKGAPGPALGALGRALAARLGEGLRGVPTRRRRVEKRIRAERREWLAQATSDGGPRMSAQWASRCIGEARGDDGVLFSEIGSDLSLMDFARPDAFFNSSSIRLECA
jgi:hypothetical protein